MDCDLPDLEFLQQLTSGLEMPMLLEDSPGSDQDLDTLPDPTSLFSDWDWGMDPVFNPMPDIQPQVSLIKEEIKLEPDVIPSSPGSSHDSWASSSGQSILETPPISPPQSSNGSPPRTPTPPAPLTRRQPPVLMVGGKPIKIVPLKQNGKTKVVVPRQVVLQPRPVSVTSFPVNPATSAPTSVTTTNTNGPKTVVLRPKDLSLLTSQVAANKTAAPTEIRIVNPLGAVNIKREPAVERPDIQIKALKRQQRMIKNRESACLSRKKKKEYITSLEYKITELEKENVQLKMENVALRARLGQCDGTTKRSGTLFTVNVKRTAVLAVLLVVSINLGSLSFLSLNRSRPDAVLSMPEVRSTRHSGRKLLWTDSELQNVTTDTQYNQHPTCPLHINQTESLRLNSELRRWIAADKPSYNNDSGQESEGDMVELPTTHSQLMLRQTPPIFPRHRRKLKITRREDQELQVVGTGPHSSLLEALRRRDDTFYVVSFSGDHLLLPALAHNSSVRPRMSLVLPALPFNASVEPAATSVTMMQIDCEVLDTRMVELNERDIPANLRQTRPPAHGRQHKNVSDEEEPVRSTYRPYFVRPNNFVDTYSGPQRGPRDPQRFP